jgi:tetratricopeptide (TPR) repeat protein
MYRKRLAAFLLLATLNVTALAAAQNFDDAIGDLAHRWAKASYDTPESERDAAFGDVIASAQQLSQSFPRKAEPLIWEAIALASAAKVEGGFGALHKVKEARDLLLAAEAVDPTAIDGAIYSTLGSLYGKVPGWPIGFGDKKKAQAYLEKAIAIDPNGIDSNYFYADFLADDAEYAKSAEYLQRALAAPPRAGRDDADAGRRKEVLGLLEALKQKHANQLAGK